MASRRNVIAADFRARDIEQTISIEERTVGVVWHIHFHADGTVEFASLEDGVSGARFMKPVKLNSAEGAACRTIKGLSRPAQLR
jgi:hypothetical protein